MTQSLISVKYLFWRFVGKVERKKIGEPDPKKSVHPAW